MPPYKTTTSGKPASPLRIVVPALVLVSLFVLIVIRGVLPLVEARLLTDKKMMIRELVRTAMQTLVYYHHREEDGTLSRAEAQKRAIQILQNMRYGPEDKDYFWINDFTPTMIMHPYREDLRGQNIADYDDSRGQFIFREVVRMARERGSGYVTYMWQWKDDPARIVPKISYIQSFKPWGWIVGTGVYIEDVHDEIESLSHRLTLLSGALLLLIIAFSGYYVWQWIGAEKKRREAWRALKESREKYMAVLESSPNAVVVYDNAGKVLYFNPAFTRIFGWELGELEGRRIDFVPEDCREETRAAIASAFQDGYFAFETRRRRKDGSVIFVQIHAATYRLGDGTTGGMVVNLEDISDRKKTELRLQESEARFRRLHEASVGAIGIHVDGRIEDVNQALARLTGYREDELVGMDGLRLIAPEWRDTVRGHIVAGTETPYEVVGLRKDGSTYPLEIQGKNIPFGGRAARVTEFRDLTERRRSEEELRDSQEMFRAIGYAARDAIVMIDNEGKIAYWSSAGEEILGYRQEDVLGRRLHAMLAPERYLADFNRAFQTFQFSGEGGAIGRTIELAARHRDGREVPVELSLASVRLKGRWHAVGIMRDISERQKTAQALRESEEKYRLLTESITETIWTMNMDMRFTYVSPTSFSIQGWTAEEMMDLSLEDIMPDGERQKALTALAQELAEGERTGDYRRSRTLELELHHKNGSRVWTEVTATLMVEENGLPYAILGVTRDVTQRKKAEAEKMELLEKLARSRKMEALGLLAGGVAHDLNNVLSGIVSYPDLILMDLPPESPLAASVLTIKDSGLKAAAIVQDLLTLARRGVTAFEVLNLNDIVSDVLRSPEHQKIVAFHPDVDFQVCCEPDLPDMEGSPVHLKKTIINLIANAAEAQPGGGRVDISTESRYVDKPMTGYDKVAEGEYILLRVADRGHGIAEEDLSRIFEPFYTKKVLGRSGTGLGMAVVWGTLQDHKGYIDIRSAVGQGTVFELYFPMTRKARADAAESARASIRGRNETLLVVDDIQEQREIASRILSRLNYAVTTVSSGEKAVAFLKANSVDLVILDMIMDPGMDGLDTYREIMAIKPDQRVIIASGFAETGRVKTALEMGVGQYVKKPYTLDKIGQAVRQELDRVLDAKAKGMTADFRQ
jgi:PAS domain S-box-containing protein